MVVNVRRGDYYSDPDNRREFGFAIREYLVAALGLAESLEPLHRVHIISDDIGWCMENLESLRPDVSVTFADPRDSPIDNFADLSGARRLVISNSTFSYWAAYVSTVLHGDNHRQVIAPSFFSRSRQGVVGWELDPRWTIVADIPGGWDSA